MSMVSIHIPDSRAVGTTEPRIGVRRVSSMTGLRKPPAKTTAQQQISILKGPPMYYERRSGRSKRAGSGHQKQ
jgi:transposase InsO family protein